MARRRTSIRRIDQPVALVAVALACSLVLSSDIAFAQRKPSQQTTPQETIDKRQLELRGLEDTIRASSEQRRKFEAELETLRHDRARLNAALIETTAAARKAESRIVVLEKQLEAQLGQEAALIRSLDARRAVMVKLLAALQRLGRNPPPALLASPDDALKAVRAAMMLSGVLPELREEARILAADLQELSAVRKRIAAEQSELSGQLKTLAGERVRLASLVEARQKSVEEINSALASERKKIGEMARQAATLKDLITRMEGEIASAQRAAEAARAAEQKRQQTATLPPGMAMGKPVSPFSDPSRLAPAIAFAEAKGLLPLPVSGELARKFGEKDAFGAEEKGISIVSPAGAAVASPSDGWISYAGPYRAYGQLLIVNAGGGYYIVLAGMERINVEVGQFVLSGEPVAAMGEGSGRSAAAVAIGAGQPVLYVEFRKDGVAIDPGPWWVKPDLQKVRG